MGGVIFTGSDAKLHSPSEATVSQSIDDRLLHEDMIGFSVKAYNY